MTTLLNVLDGDSFARQINSVGRQFEHDEANILKGGKSVDSDPATVDPKEKHILLIEEADMTH